MAPNYQLPITNYPPRLRRAFTLMEMMVAVSILVVIILSVGVIFKSASNAVGLSQSSLEMLSNVRGIQQQISYDVAHMDRNSFLVIRCQFDPNDTSRRFDQISFIAKNGSFPNRTGTTGVAKAVFTDSTVAPTAFIWWGQLAVQSSDGTVTAYDSNTAHFLQADQNNKIFNPSTPDDWYKQVPNGVDNQNLELGRNFELGRNTILLVPQDSSTNAVTPSGTSIFAYPTIDFTAANASANMPSMKASGETKIAYIASSRFAVATSSPTQLMTAAQDSVNGVPAGHPRFEADHYCYRFATLRSVYDSNETGTGFANGYFRMHPIALQGCSSFAVDWTDGQLFVDTDIDPASVSKSYPNGQTAKVTGASGTTKWYGPLTYPTGTVPLNPAASPIGPLPSIRGVPTSSEGDSYTAIFSYDTVQTKWPKALRFRYHLADPTGRIPNGRDFVQVVSLPTN